MATKALYQELIIETLTENKVKRMTFKGDTNFAKKYDHVDVENNHINVFLKDLVSPFGNFYFDFTLDYATLLQMIEEDLFLAIRKGETTNFDFIFE